MTIDLGVLEKINPRLAWPKEDEDFTPWLASPAGLRLIGQALNIELEREAEEHVVGPFRADILARRTDTPDEQWVVIENQLAKSDHSHLGQLLTYAAGVKAKAIVWVATQFVEEHRAAIDWLNEMTKEGIGFFALEIELLRIGSSPPAPNFRLVAKPNDYSRAIAEAKTAEAALSALQVQQRRYWEGLRAVLLESGSALTSQKPPPQAWTDFALGRTNIWLSATINTNVRAITAECRMRGTSAPAWFEQLKAERAVIEGAVGTLEWDQKDGRDLHKIIIRKPDGDPSNEADWPAQHDWLATKLGLLHKSLSPRVQLLSAYAEKGTTTV